MSGRSDLVDIAGEIRAEPRDIVADLGVAAFNGHGARR